MLMGIKTDQEENQEGGEVRGGAQRGKGTESKGWETEKGKMGETRRPRLERTHRTRGHCRRKGKDKRLGQPGSQTWRQKIQRGTKGQRGSKTRNMKRKKVLSHRPWTVDPLRD